MYELAFLKEKELLIIPSLLSTDTPSELPDFTNVEHLAMEFKMGGHLPVHVVPRIIVNRAKEASAGSAQLWQRGAVLKNHKGTATAQIEMNEDEKTVRLTVKGDDKKNYISELCNTITGIFESYSKNFGLDSKLQKYIAINPNDYQPKFVEEDSFWRIHLFFGEIFDRDGRVFETKEIKDAYFIEEKDIISEDIEALVSTSKQLAITPFLKELHVAIEKIPSEYRQPLDAMLYKLVSELKEESAKEKSDKVAKIIVKFQGLIKKNLPKIAEMAARNAILEILKKLLMEWS
jgi:hypothetical protein